VTTKDFATEALTRVERVAAVVRRIIGVPDYDRYVAHINTQHPGCAPMSREEFITQRMADRYNKPGSRCC
jgi:uncharacterized short protein YbdD (DUF466 family)